MTEHEVNSPDDGTDADGHSDDNTAGDSDGDTAGDTAALLPDSDPGQTDAERLSVDEGRTEEDPEP